MYEKEKQELIKCGMEMLRYGLVSLTGGNVSLRLDDGTFLVTPSAMLYEDMEEDDIVRLDCEKKILEGRRRPSSDTDALLYIFRHKPEVKAIIHTHQPYATAAGLIGDCLPACLTTIIDTAHGDVPVTPFTVSSDEGMGVQTVRYCGASDAVILGNHGVIAMGDSVFSALETAVYLEEGAKAYLAARAAGSVKYLTKEQIEQEDMDRGNNGQQ